MKKIALVPLVGILLLSACSTGNQQSEQQSTTNSETSNEIQTSNQAENTEDIEESSNENNQPEGNNEDTSGTSNGNNQSEERSEQSHLTDKEREMIENLPEDASTDDWNLLLVNPEVSLPENYNVNLTDIGGEKVDQRIASNWYAWEEAAANNGFNIFVASGYRSVQLQETNYNNTLQSYIDQGYSEEEATRLTEEYLTQPRHSEHHTGLAIDILDSEWSASGRGLEVEFETQESQQWMVETMADYGFILRYPEGKENITSIQYEPWHFRFVGKENAQFINKYNLAFEEYIALLDQREQLSEDRNS